jgi:hypothetical protein
MMATYTYSPLKEGESIRVLTLLHDPDSPIHCQLHACKHKDELEDDALSYAWQGEEPASPNDGPNIQRGCKRQDLVGKRRGK